MRRTQNSKTETQFLSTGAAGPHSTGRLTTGQRMSLSSASNLYLVNFYLVIFLKPKAPTFCPQVLLDRSTGRLTTGQRVSLNSVESTEAVERDGVKYFVYEHVSQVSLVPCER